MGGRPLAMTVVPLVALAAALAATFVTVNAADSSPTGSLYRRARDWQDALSDADPAARFPFLDPGTRGDPRMRAPIEDQAEMFRKADARRLVRVTVTGPPAALEGRSEHVIDARGSASRGPPEREFQFAWNRAAGGEWYVDLRAEQRR